MSSIKIIVGLGNPGREYERTYHNVGKLGVDSLAKEWGVKFKTHKSNLFSYAKAMDAILIKPSVFMNESGIAVLKALRFFKCSPEALLVLHDDSDIALGNVKYAFDRGPAGHRGVTSIIHELKTKKFFRMRIGIRTKPGKAGTFVLKKIGEQDQGLFESLFLKFMEKLREKDSFCS